MRTAARRPLTIDEWQAEGRARFDTNDARLWRFLCPSCGHEQTGRDFLDVGLPAKQLSKYLAFSCVGRFRLNVPARADAVAAWPDPDRGQGCTYPGSAGLAPIDLDCGGDAPRPTFAFAP